MSTMSGGSGPSTASLYGAAIAIVSGLYSLLSVSGGMIGGSGMMGGGLGLGRGLMLVLGVVVLVHGIVLLTPAAASIGSASGPLMIGYAVVMLLTQGLGLLTRGFASGTAMPGGMGGQSGSMMGSQLTAGMGWDLGMVAIAVLMMISGLIMTTRDRDGM